MRDGLSNAAGDDATTQKTVSGKAFVEPQQPFADTETVRVGNRKTCIVADHPEIRHMVVQPLHFQENNATILQASLLILDEPTAVLTPQETEALFMVLNRLIASGRTVIFITHKLNEIMTFCSKATILRRGVVAGTLRIADTNEVEITRLMMGQQVDIFRSQPTEITGPSVLELRDLNAFNDRNLLAIKNLSFNIRAGEIVGVAGVEGNGQSELIEVLAGLRRSKGKILLNGVDVDHSTPRERRQLGLAIIPEDRRHQGLNLLGTIIENIGATRYFQPRFSRFGVQNRSALEKAAEAGIRDYQIKAENANTRLSILSGGNAQKVVIARELAETPKLLIAAQPTRGLDVFSSQSVRRVLVRMKAEGVAVLLLSADLDEILSVADRILVMFQGQIVGELSPQEASYERLGL